MLSYRDLSPRLITGLQNAGLLNGLGAWWMGKRLRDYLKRKLGWYFKEANFVIHDTGYLIGGTSLDRRICDVTFYKYMLDDARLQPLELQNKARRSAFILFVAVRIGGAFSFHHGTPKTIEEIEALI